MIKSQFKNLTLALICTATILLLTACGGGSGDSSPTPSSSLGTLSTSLADSSTEEYRAIYVTVDRVEVKPDNGDWKTVATPGGTYDLLSLVNGVREELGISFLDSGHYNQMRLIIGKTADQQLNLLDAPHPHANYLIDQSDDAHELKIPSGFNTGIKIVHGFDIAEDQTTELILDFNAMKSVVKAGSSGKYLLKPTIKVIGLSSSATVSGLVVDGTTGIEGAAVNVQTFSATAEDSAEQVAVVRGTVTAGDDTETDADETGQYSLCLPAGDYNLVAYFTDYEPICRAITLAVADNLTENFALNSALTGTVAGTVDITDADVDQHVTIDFRQTGHCADVNTVINVKSVGVEAGGEYSVILPVGTYTVVTSSDGETTQVEEVTVIQDATISHNISL